MQRENILHLVARHSLLFVTDMKVEPWFLCALDEYADSRLSYAGLSLLFAFTEKLTRDLVLF